MPNSPRTSLWYLFTTFLKVGATSFGGNVALVSVVQSKMVQRDRVIDDSVILDGVSLGSILPGPLAVNVCTYIGYHLRGMAGALICMGAVLVPSFALVLALSWSYFEYGDVPAVEHIFKGIMPAVIAIIISVAINMARKNLKYALQWVFCVGGAAAFILYRDFYMTVLIMAVAGLVGALLFRSKIKEGVVKAKAETAGSFAWQFGLALSVVAVLAIIPYFLPEVVIEPHKLLHELLVTFGSMGVTLFGGGYVMIPAMQEIIVDKLDWLTSQEFADGIAMGQITPGPILISATFVGYKVAGIKGAVVATFAMFFPPAMLMVLASRFYTSLKHNKGIQAAFLGVRPAVIGLIVSGAYVLGRSLDPDWYSLVIFVVVLALILKFKLNALYLIPLAGVVGFLIY